MNHATKPENNLLSPYLPCIIETVRTSHHKQRIETVATKVIKKITKKNQGELQGKINSSYNSDNPSKYYASYIETEDGKVFLVAKPLRIEKNFCFAEGRTRDISEAIKLAEKAKRDRDHFISKNVQRAGLLTGTQNVNF